MSNEVSSSSAGDWGDPVIRGGPTRGGTFNVGALGQSEEIERLFVLQCAFDIAVHLSDGKSGSECCILSCKLRDGQHGVSL